MQDITECGNHQLNSKKIEEQQIVGRGPGDRWVHQIGRYDSFQWQIQWLLP